MLQLQSHDCLTSLVILFSLPSKPKDSACHSQWKTSGKMGGVEKEIQTAQFFCASVSPLLKLTSSRPHNPRQQRKNPGLVGLFPQPRETQWGTVTACPSQLRPYTFRADSGWELSPSQCVLFCLYSRNQSWPLGTGRAASGTDFGPGQQEPRIVS